MAIKQILVVKELLITFQIHVWPWADSESAPRERGLSHATKFT